MDAGDHHLPLKQRSNTVGHMHSSDSTKLKGKIKALEDVLDDVGSVLNNSRKVDVLSPDHLIQMQSMQTALNERLNKAYAIQARDQRDDPLSSKMFSEWLEEQRHE
jgi:hypothetical protein